MDKDRVANIIALALQKQTESEGVTGQNGGADVEPQSQARPNSLHVTEPLPLPPRKAQR